MTPTKQHLVGVDGNPLRMQGTAVVCITLAGKKFTTKVTTLDGISAEAILGIRRRRLYQCWTKSPIHTDPGASAGAVQQDQPEYGMSQMPVTCVPTTDVPAHRELEMIVETTQCAEGSMDDRLQVMITCAVLCPSDQVVAARVITLLLRQYICTRA